MKSRFLIYSMALAVASIAQAGYTPVAIQSSSYNADVIVEIVRVGLAFASTMTSAL